MTSSQKILAPVFSLFLIVLTACGGGAVARQGEGGDSADAEANWLVGAWSGLYSSQDEGSVSAAPTKVVLTFREDLTFSILVDGTTDPAVVGTYEEYPGALFALTLQKSGLSKLGSDNSVAQLRYDRVTTRMTLVNEKVKFLLKKDAAAPPTDVSKDPLVGNWNCTDTHFVRWDLMVDGESTFWATVRGGGAPLSMRGEVVLVDAATNERQFTVTSASDKNSQGAVFRGGIGGDGTLKLKTVNGDANYAVNCQKI